MQLEKALNIKFNPKQKSAIKSLRLYFKNSGKEANGKDLTGQNRQTGRTTLGLALIIEIALENLGQPIKIFDHYLIVTGEKFVYKRRMCERLQKMVDDSNLENLFEIDENNGTITAFTKEL